jgi:signal transduction histidine kinase
VLGLKRRSLAFRLAVGSAIWIGAGLAVGGGVLAALYTDYVERNFDDRLLVFSDSLIASAETMDGRFVLSRPPEGPPFELPYSGWYWQVEGERGERFLSRSLWDFSLKLPPVNSEARRAYEATGPGGQELRVLERTLAVADAAGRFRFVVAADLGQLEADVRPFQLTLAISLAALWLGLVAAAVLQIRIGLRPLDRLRVALAAVRSGRSVRLEGEFPSEVRPLAEEFNAYLEHVSTVVERARTHVGNLAHALKTPLSVLRNEADGASGPLAQSVLRQTDAMGRRIDHHLVRARTVGSGSLLGARSDVEPVLEDLRRTMLRVHAARHLDVGVDSEPGLVFRGDRQDLKEVVGNLFDNACKWARTSISIVAAREQDRVTISVEDDGPGLPPERGNLAPGRGERLDESVPGSGLGLSIVREVVGLYRGEMELGRSELGGLKVRVVLPGVGPE